MRRSYLYTLAALVITQLYFAFLALQAINHNDKWMFNNIIFFYLILVFILITFGTASGKRYVGILIALILVSINVLTPVVKYNFTPYNPTDSLAHLSFAKWITEHGHVAPPDAPLYYAKEEKYSFAPVIHILLASSSIISDVPLGYVVTVMLLIQNFLFFIFIILITNCNYKVNISSIGFLILQALLINFPWFSSVSAVLMVFPSIIVYLIILSQQNNSTKVIQRQIIILLIVYVAFVFSHPAYHVFFIVYFIALIITIILQKRKQLHSNSTVGKSVSTSRYHLVVLILFMLVTLVAIAYIFGDIIRLIKAVIYSIGSAEVPKVYQVYKAQELGLSITKALAILVSYYGKLIIAYMGSLLILLAFVVSRFFKNKKSTYFANNTVIFLVLIIVSYLLSILTLYVHKGIEALYRITPFLSMGYIPVILAIQARKRSFVRYSNALSVREFKYRHLYAGLLIAAIIIANVINFPLEPTIPFIESNNMKYKPGGTVLLVSHKLVAMVRFTKVFTTKNNLIGTDVAFFPIGIIDQLHHKYTWIKLLNYVNKDEHYVYIVLCFSETDMSYGSGMQALLNELFYYIIYNKHYSIILNVGLNVILK